MGEILGSCVGLISGSRWRTLRTVTETPFLHSNIASYIPQIERRTEKHFGSLQLESRLSRGFIHPVDDLKLLPFWIIADILYGELSMDMEAQLKALIPIRESLFGKMITGMVSRFRVSQYFPSAANRTLSDFRRSWIEFNEKAYQESSTKILQTPFISMYRQAQNDKITFDELYQTMDEMLFANLDVTIGGISWNLLFLGEHQDSQADLRAELNGKRRESGEGLCGWDNYMLSSSTLLAASILESARLRPLAAFSVPQATPGSRTAAGFIIPAGTNIVVDAYALNIRNPYWGSDSTEYRPKRFLQRSPIETRYHYWRYGFGPRTCMGRYVADLIIRIILAHLVENYRLSLIGDVREWDRNPETWITHPNTDVRCEKL